jgi:hypothetical protein
MSRKWRERREQRLQGKAPAPVKSAATIEALRRRRNRRFLFVGLIGISFPILEAIAYQFRTVTISMVNRSDLLVKRIKLTYAGGEIDVPELKPGGSFSRLIRPNYTFKFDQFSTYPMSIRFATEDGQIIGQMGRAGTLDYSPTELYTIVQTPPEGRIQLQHNTRPGFPLSLVRNLMERLGFG